MRRGLISWSHDEEPAGALEARLAAVQTAMREGGYDAFLIYTDFTRPSAVSRLSHFIPYWNRGVLVVLPDRPLALVCALSNRVSGWIRETSAVDDVICTQDLAGGTADKLQTGGVGNRARIGVVEIGSFPRGILEEIVTKTGGPAVQDVTGLFEKAMAAAPGPGALLVKHALASGEAAIRAARDTFSAIEQGSAAVAAAEQAARNAGAEEVLIAVAPDAANDPRLRRIEGRTAFGRSAFLRVSVAYKGYWHRIGTTLEPTNGSTSGHNHAETALRAAVRQQNGAPDPEGLAAAVADSSGAEVLAWSLEGAWGGLPLARLAGSGATPRGEATGLLSLTVRLALADGQWYGAHPLVAGRAAA